MRKVAVCRAIALVLVLFSVVGMAEGYPGWNVEEDGRLITVTPEQREAVVHEALPDGGGMEHVEISMLEYVFVGDMLRVKYVMKPTDGLELQSPSVFSDAVEEALHAISARVVSEIQVSCAIWRELFIWYRCEGGCVVIHALILEEGAPDRVEVVLGGELVRFLRGELIEEIGPLAFEARRMGTTERSVYPVDQVVDGNFITGLELIRTPFETWVMLVYYPLEAQKAEWDGQRPLEFALIDGEGLKRAGGQRTLCRRQALTRRDARELVWIYPGAEPVGDVLRMWFPRAELVLTFDVRTGTMEASRAHKVETGDGYQVIVD